MIHIKCCCQTWLVFLLSLLCYCCLVIVYLLVISFLQISLLTACYLYFLELRKFKCILSIIFHICNYCCTSLQNTQLKHQFYFLTFTIRYGESMMTVKKSNLRNFVEISVVGCPEFKMSIRLYMAIILQRKHSAGEKITRSIFTEFGTYIFINQANIEAREGFLKIFEYKTQFWQ